MRETGETLNPINLPEDLLKEIFLRLPLKSLVKSKTVSKEWRSILESKSFFEMHLKAAAGKSWPLTTATAATGLNSHPIQDPKAVKRSCTCTATQHDRRFPSGPDPVPSIVVPRYRRADRWLTFFPGYCAMGFGRDKVTGSYKVVRMCFDPVECDVLAVETGEWRKLRPLLTRSMWEEDRLV